MKLLTIWQEFNKTAKTVIIILAVVLIGSFVLSFAQESKIDRWREAYEEFQDSAQAVLEFADSVEALADSAMAVADSAKQVADSVTQEIEIVNAQAAAARRQNRVLEARNDSIFDEITEGVEDVEEAVAAAPEPAKPWVRLSFSLRNENLELRNEVDLLHMQINNFEIRDNARLGTIAALEATVIFQKERADSLEAIVLAIPDAPPREKLLGIIPLPSRKTSFVVGAVVGVVTTAVIIEGLSGN